MWHSDAPMTLPFVRQPGQLVQTHCRLLCRLSAAHSKVRTPGHERLVRADRVRVPGELYSRSSSSVWWTIQQIVFECLVCYTADRVRAKESLCDSVANSRYWLSKLSFCGLATMAARLGISRATVFALAILSMVSTSDLFWQKRIFFFLKISTQSFVTSTGCSYGNGELPASWFLHPSFKPSLLSPWRRKGWVFPR